MTNKGEFVRNILYQFVAEMLTFLCSNKSEVRKEAENAFKPSLMTQAYSWLYYGKLATVESIGKFDPPTRGLVDFAR